MSPLPTLYVCVRERDTGRSLGTQDGGPVRYVYVGVRMVSL